MGIANGAGNFPLVYGAVPCEGTKAFPFNLDFTAATGYQIDLTQQYNQKQFTTLQTVYIDNSLSDEPLIIQCSATNQVVTCPPQAQGFFALLQPVPPKFNVTSNGNLIVEIILLNFYIPPQVWTITQVSSSGLPQVDVPALDGVISGGKVQTAGSPPTLTGYVDGSSTITAGGVAQALFGASATRQRFIISNPASATEELDFNISGGGFISLLPGQTWDESGSTICGDAVEIKAATTGHAFTAYSR